MRQRILPEEVSARSFGITMSPGAKWRRRASHWHQILASAKGSFQLDSGETSWRISPGQALLIPAGRECCISLLEKCDIRALFLPELEFQSVQLVRLSPLLRELLFQISTLGALSSADERDRALLTLTIAELKAAPSVPLQSEIPRSFPLMKAAESLLSKSSVEEAAAQANLSKRTLERKFRKEVGMGVAEWSRESRLVKAAQAILDGQPISQVAFDSGYSTPSAFIYAFKAKFGAPPSKFRSHYIMP